MNEPDQIKEVYARFGLALYFVQVLEHQMVNMFVAAKLPEKNKVPVQEIDCLFDMRFNQTMGKLIKDLQTEFNLSEEEKSLLDSALKERNWLAHRYFREKAVDFMKPEGRSKMIEELALIVDHFENLDKILTRRHREYTKRYGINEEMIEKKSTIY